MKYGERLKKARAHAGLTQPALANKVGMSQPNISNLENGDATGSEFTVQLAVACGVRPEWLAFENGEMAENTPSVREPEKHYGKVDYFENIPLRGRVPIISWVAAGNWSELVDNFEPGDADDWVVTTVSVKRHTYALRVQGDSMEPKFPDGAIIVIEPEEEARNGSFVIIRQNGNEATFKQLVIDGGMKYLKPLNDRYPIMALQPDAVLCGVVKQMVMDV